MSGFTGPTGTFEVVNIIPNFTGPTGLYPQWAAYTGPTGASGQKGGFKSVINIGPTGPSSVSPGKGVKTVIIPGFAGAAAASAWNPADFATGMVLSGANKIATLQTTGVNSGVRGATSHASGKWYLEYSSIVNGGFHGKRGFASAAQILSNFDTTHSFGLQESGNFDTPTGGTLGTPAGHTAQVAIDIDAGVFWVRYDGAGNWLGVALGGTTNPATGVNGSNYTGNGCAAGTAVFPCFMGFSNVGNIMTTTITTDLASFLSAPPAGFSAWG